VNLKKPSISRAYVLWTIAATLVVEGALASVFLIPGIAFDNKLGISLFATVPAFVITIIQIIRTQQIQRAAYMKDFLTEFQKNSELYSTYHDLVYRYRDQIFEKVEAAAKEHLNGRTALTADEKPEFNCLSHVQKSTEEGKRFFHPLFFQFSPEEKKLDGLLDYFNTIGFYLYQGMVRIEDVVAVLGDYLAVLADRKIVDAYLATCDDPTQWKYDDTVGATTPYRHLRFLLESYQEYNFNAYRRRKRKELLDVTERMRRQVEQRKAQSRVAGR